MCLCNVESDVQRCHGRSRFTCTARQQAKFVACSQICSDNLIGLIRLCDESKNAHRRVLEAYRLLGYHVCCCGKYVCSFCLSGQDIALKCMRLQLKKRTDVFHSFPSYSHTGLTQCTCWDFKHTPTGQALIVLKGSLMSTFVITPVMHRF